MTLSALLEEVRACRACADLPMGPRPVLQAGAGARVLIVGQAPGRRAHLAGRPFDDPSGERLRDWLGVDRTAFYDPSLFALVPMGFCYPGTGRAGDMAPRVECAPLWRDRLLARLPGLRLTLLLGRFAIGWHLPAERGRTIAAMLHGRGVGPDAPVPLPHPSPRNNRWLRNHPWFEAEVLPGLKAQVRTALGTGAGDGAPVLPRQSDGLRA